MAITVRLDTARLEQIAGALKINAEAVCVRFAFQVERMAKQLAPYEFGALSNSIYTVTRSESGAGAAEAAALQKNPQVKFVEIPAPDDPNIFANVGPGVEYGIYQELGTSKMAAQPYLTPAIEQVYADFSSGEEWRKIVE